MTELDLYKWVEEWNPEHRWDMNGSKKDDVIIWISLHSLESFMKLLPFSLFEEGGIEVRLLSDSIAIWASDICDPLDLDIKNIFPKD
jgi:hypothetical protein